MTTTSGTGGPIALSARALGPDLARGWMLLFIALANTHYFLGAGAEVRGGFPVAGSAVDHAVTWAISTFVDGRAFPMFGFLFGYGVAHIVRRQGDRPRREVRHLLWRRAAVLVGVGLIDGLFFYVGDILAMYGALLLVGAWVVFWPDRWLLVTAALFFVLNALPSEGSSSVSTDRPDPSMLPPDLATLLTDRPVGLAIVALLGPLGFACPALLGLWAGRRRLLERPAETRRALVAIAAVGVPVAVLGAQPVALVLAGVTGVPDADVLDLIGPLHDATGVLGGLGYAALVTLVAQRLEARGRPQGRVVGALAAAGQRSMTCYLLQSVAWAILFTPFLLDLSGRLTVATTALLATAVWAGSVLLADGLARRGRRGPFEVLVRRVTYR
ncbi:DUF418 domain-containing protein [Pimelobacter simplex]|uniref:Uncharacterized protein n=2 Tax=Nocardioides simplex TaxID=2045 RepID=A0A0A1DVT4_NOCSI|nr:DUF418 domain-containing protein [Pimelobacter simplex]AIY19540.1 hypothetical protein KR76_27200 [Pimelobacter simplex]SFM83703.1 Uncharacterized membrane protein YeiB [Pimelobacter simplex]